MWTIKYFYQEKWPELQYTNGEVQGLNEDIGEISFSESEDFFRAMLGR